MASEAGCQGERDTHSFPEKPEDGQKSEMLSSSHDKCSYPPYLAGKENALIQEGDLSGAKHYEGHEDSAYTKGFTNSSIQSQL